MQPARPASTQKNAPARNRAQPQRKAAVAQARHGADAHEQQAERAGQRFVAGEYNLANSFTPTQAARFSLPDSAARLLPRQLRQELEAAFDADFSGLRIHTDASASFAAQAQHARAFAAGGHIFFGSGEFNPHSQGGRELIAHEVMHTLQQAGRRSGVRHWSVPAIGGGSGAIQCAPNQKAINATAISLVFKTDDVLQPAKNTSECLAAMERHLTSYKGSPPAKVQELADKIKTQVDAKPLDDAISELDTLYGALTAEEKTDPVKRLFFDAYKSLNAYSDAKLLMGDTVPDNTAAGRWDYYTTYLRGNASWVTALLRTHPVAKNYYPGALVAVAKFDFYGLTRGALNLDPNLQFVQKMAVALEESHTYSPLMPNEKTAAALAAFFVFDVIRKWPFAEMERTLKGEKSLAKRADAKRVLIRAFAAKDYLPNMVKQNSADPEVLAIANEVSELIAPIAERADRYWSSVGAFTLAVLSSVQEPEAIEKTEKLRTAIREQFPQIAEFKGVEARLVKVLDKASKTGAKGALPTPKQLMDNVGAASSEIAALVFELDQSLVKREKKLVVTEVAAQEPIPGAPPKIADPAAESVTQDMVYGAVLQLLFALQSNLVAYQAPPAGNKKDEDARLQSQDNAVAHYMHNASLFLSVGNIIGLKTLAEKAAQILNAQQGDLQQSYVGLLAPFEKQTSTLQDFSKDFPTGEQTTSALSGASDVQFVFTLYYEGLLTQLNAALTTEVAPGVTREFDADPDKKPIINTAIEQTDKAFNPPRKYVVPAASTVLYIRPEDAQKVADFLPRNHPMLNALVSAELGTNDDGFVPQNLSSHTDGFVVWLIPDMDKLADRIASIQDVPSLLLKDGTSLGLPKDYQTPRDWMLKLNEAVKLAPKWHDTLRDTLKQQMDDSLSKLDEPLRRATNNHRRVMLKEISASWEMLDKPDVGKNIDTFFGPPRRAINLMERFAREVQPPSEHEQQLQVTALLLELAPLLTRKLGNEYLIGESIRIAGTSRLDIVLPLYAYVQGAADLVAATPNLWQDLQQMQIDFPILSMAPRALQLKQLAQQFKTTAQGVQANTVLAGNPSENMLHVPDRGYAVIASEDPERNAATFHIDGVFYTLLQVHKSFEFEPGLLTKPAVMRWNKDDLGQSRLWIDGKEAAADDHTPLVTIMRKPDDGKEVKVTITAADREQLSELTYAVHMNIVLRQLADLQVVMEVFASGVTTALQIAFPEVAPYIAYAEIAGSMMQFFSGPEFAQMQSAFDSDSGQFFDDILDKFKKELTVDTLWNFMLFDDVPPILQPLRKAMDLVGHMKSMETRPEPKTQAASSNVFGRIKKAGLMLAKGVDITKDQISYPVRATSLFVEGSPWVAILVRFVARNLHRLEGLDLKEFGIDSAVDMIAQVQQLYLRFENIIDGLANYELPEELVPLEAIVEMTVNFVLDRLPLKYRVPLKVSRSIPEVELIFQWIFGVVAKELRNASLDPNILWRDYARKEINPYLNAAGKEISGEVHGLLTRVPFLKTLATMNLSDLAAQFTHTEVQPKLAPGSSSLGAAAALPAKGGKTMPREMMGRAHSGFGHDFSHVRLHRGAHVDNSLRSARAMAATSGSHVYLDRSVSLGSQSGRDVVHHELAHVLQQTGQRPLSQRHSSAPMPGRSGVGWRVDHGAEAQADRLAQQSRSPAPAARPVSAATGVQPKLTSVITKFFLDLGDPAKITTHANEVLEGKVDTAAIDAAAPGLRDALGTKLVEALKSRGKPNSPTTFTAPFDLLGEELVDYVVNNRKASLLEAMPHLLMTGAESIPKKKANTPNAKQESFWILKTDKVETALEEFFFGKSGVSVDVEFNTKKEAGPDGKMRQQIDVTNPFKTLKINYVHLPMIGGDAAIWKKIMENSFPSVAADKMSLYQSKARLALLGKKPSPGLYTSSGAKGSQKLAFSKAMKIMIESYVNPPPDRKVPGDAAPKWADYINTKPLAPVQIGSDNYGQLGLRLGFYNQRDNPATQKGSDRASHHTVQYLLIEYLVNSKDRHKPFPHNLDLYPNITASGQSVSDIRESPGGASPIFIAKHDPSRGGEMPTILLSNHAHTLGDVHVSPKPDDVADKPASQGAAIHGEFKNALGAYKDIVTGDKKGLEAMAKKRAGKPMGASIMPQVGGADATDAGLSTAIYDASCKTYTWMRDLMNDKLTHALDHEEVDYYESLVSASTNTAIYASGAPQAGYKATPPSQTVMPQVKTKQTEKLESSDFGFKVKT